MNTTKKYQVLLLSANKKDGEINKHLGADYETSWLSLANGNGNNHLYIVSNDEIKKGDWYVHNQGSNGLRVWQHKGVHLPIDSKKILATTDSSIEHEILIEGMPASVPLPKPSQQFIEEYIEEYDKGNQIKEVMVEHEDRPIKNGLDEYNAESANFYNKLKINTKDNTIITHIVKDSWSRDGLKTVKQFVMIKIQ